MSEDPKELAAKVLDEMIDAILKARDNGSIRLTSWTYAKLGGRLSHLPYEREPPPAAAEGSLACPNCGLPINEQTQNQFVGDPGDFAHNSWRCLPRVLAELQRLRERAIGLIAERDAERSKASDIRLAAIDECAGVLKVKSEGLVCSDYCEKWCQKAIDDVRALSKKAR